MVPSKQLLLNVPFQSTKYGKKEMCVDIIKTIGDVYCPTCGNEKCVYISTNIWIVSTIVKSAKPAVSIWIFLLRTKNRHLCCLVVTVHIDLQERRVEFTRSYLHSWRTFSANHNQAHPNLNQKKLKRVQKWIKRIRSLLVDNLRNILVFQIILFNFNLQSTAQI